MLPDGARAILLAGELEAQVGPVPRLRTLLAVDPVMARIYPSLKSIYLKFLSLSLEKLTELSSVDRSSIIRRNPSCIGDVHNTLSHLTHNSQQLIQPV